MPFFAAHAELSPLIVVRSVDREKTIGIFVVIDEREAQRSFFATQIRVVQGERFLRPEAGTV